MLGVRAHLHMTVHLCMFVSDLPRQVSVGAMIRIDSFLSASFSQATQECVEHPHAQALNQCESRRERNRGGRRDNAGGEKRQTLRVCLRERESGREIRGSLK